LEDDRAVEKYARTLEEIEQPEHEVKFARYYAATVRALLAWERGEAERTLEILDSVPVPLRPFWHIALKSLDHARYARAEALTALGRTEEALGWYATIGYYTPLEGHYWSPALFHRAQIREEMGDREKAIEGYTRFIDLWKDCDPEFRPMVEEAEERLSALEEEEPAA
jgi:tetratricopeptide (TPR) repeat protein